MINEKIYFHRREMQYVHKMFVRTVPPFKHQSVVMVELLKNLNWHKVIFLYSADEEGRSILSQFQTLAETPDYDIRVRLRIYIYPGLIII